MPNRLPASKRQLYNCLYEHCRGHKYHPAVALDEPEKAHIIQLTSGANVIAPEILPYEIGNALSAMLKRQQISRDEALAALDTTGLIPVRLIATDIAQALEIAIEFNIHAYDAYFLLCARAESCQLMTLDKQMKRVARELKIKVLE